MKYQKFQKRKKKNCYGTYNFLYIVLYKNRRLLFKIIVATHADKNRDRNGEKYVCLF